MKTYYPEGQDPSKEDSVAQLVVHVSKDNEMSFDCNWESDQQGIQGVGAIFYKMAYDNLAEQILNHLQAQCVLENSEAEFTAIMQSIKDFILSDTTNASEKTLGESVVVPPRGVFRL
tara:strand:- start:97 stop:447 length:351 start_codon:yes stop_codon:yes gene_type:complete